MLVFENLLGDGIHLFIDRANELPARFDAFRQQGLLFNIEGGMDWGPYLDSAIFHCAIVAPMMSSQSATSYCASAHCRHELEQAVRHQKTILPISTDDRDKAQKTASETFGGVRLQGPQWRQARVGEDVHFARDMEILRGDIKKRFAAWLEARQTSHAVLLRDRQRDLARRQFNGLPFRTGIAGNVRFALIPPEHPAGDAYYMSCKPISDKPMRRAEVTEALSPPVLRLPNETELAWALEAGHPGVRMRNPFGIEAKADPGRYWTQEKWSTGDGRVHLLLLLYRLI